MTAEKNWFLTNYAEDIHKHLRYKEKKRYLYKGNSPQLNIRPKMIAFMDKICEKMEYCTIVQHLAVYLMDIFMDNHLIYAKHLELVTLGCLLVSVKLEEQDRFPPRYSEFMPFLSIKYKIPDFVSIEVSILTFFKWNMLFPTAAHFTEYYLLFSLSANDLLNGKPLSCYNQVEVFEKKYVEYFLDVIIRDREYISFSPSLVAAACIAATRRCMLIEPIWSEELQKITCYSYPQIQHCTSLLLSALDEDMLKQSKKPEKNCTFSTIALKRKIDEVESRSSSTTFVS